MDQMFKKTFPVDDVNEDLHPTPSKPESQKNPVIE
jgi:hypothetical protein